MIKAEENKNISTFEMIINDPYTNIESLKSFLTSKDEETSLSVAKIFANIVPLYKIKTNNNKVKQKIGHQSTVSDYDKKLLEFYTVFLKNVLNNKNDDFTYKIAAYLLDELDHFNFNDRLVSKVLEGCKNNNIICQNVITKRIENDTNGEILFFILDKSLDMGFNKIITEALLKSRFLNKCVEIRIAKENKYAKEEKKKVKERRNLFDNRNLKGREKKREKERYKKQKEVKAEIDEEMEGVDHKVYVKCVNALQRFYFTILKNKEVNCVGATCSGLRKYFKIIRKEFHEGIMFMLYDNVNLEHTNNTLNIIRTVFIIFKDAGIDFNKLIDVLYEIIDVYMENKRFKELLDDVLLKNTQSYSIALKFYKKLLVIRILHYSTWVDEIIHRISIKYDINYKDEMIFEYIPYHKLIK